MMMGEKDETRLKIDECKPAYDVTHAVKLSSLSNMVRWLSANNDRLFKREFQDVEEDVDSRASEGLKPYNRAKNRYSTIISYDHNRVKLQFTGEDGSDYVNASWIEGEDGRPRIYIAAQAPLQYTVCDMWRMVWEYRVGVIIMTTALTEAGKEKCVRYWPAGVGEVLSVDSSRIGGELRVTLKASEQQSNWQHKVLTVEEMTYDEQEEDQQPLTVHHYQYTEWPDRGVPSSPASLLHLLHHIHTAHPLPSSQEQHPQPLLAHCSAGVGRTGTLLAVDRLLRQVACGAHTVNVLQTVRELRSCRPGMVLNDAQYKFIYSCLDYVVRHGGLPCANSMTGDTPTASTTHPDSD